MNEQPANAEQPATPFLHCVGYLALGLSTLLFGLGWATSTIMWPIGKQTIQGTVDRVERGKGGQLPVVRYEVNGQTFEVKGIIRISVAPFRSGDKAHVFYDPTAPQKAMVDAFADRWLFPLVFGAIGLGFSIAGSQLLFRRAWTSSQ